MLGAHKKQSPVQLRCLQWLSILAHICLLKVSDVCMRTMIVKFREANEMMTINAQDSKSLFGG